MWGVLQTTRTMKTIFTIILVLLIGVSVFTPNTVNSTATKTNVAPSTAPTEFYFEEEAYVDDIPFDTKAIADSAS